MKSSIITRHRRRWHAVGASALVLAGVVLTVVVTTQAGTSAAGAAIANAADIDTAPSSAVSSAQSTDPSCGPRHTNNSYTAFACLEFDGSGLFETPVAYVTTAGGSGCQVVISLYYPDYDNIDTGGNLEPNLQQQDKHPCIAGTFPYTGRKISTLLGPERTVVDVVDNNVTQVIADSPQVSSSRSASLVIDAPATPASPNDAPSTDGPGSGTSSTIPPIEIYCTVNYIDGLFANITVTGQAHLNPDGTISKVDSFAANVTGINAIATVQNDLTSALIANGGHSVELNSIVDVTYGVPVRGLQLGATHTFTCESYYTF